jgi:hypothetical protein
MFRLVLSSSFSVAFLAAAPAVAQVFKWVDDKGVVNYSNEAPANRSSTLLDPKSARVSTYATDDLQKRAPTAPPSANESALSEKIDRLERKLDSERYARQRQAEAQLQVAADARYQQCVRDRRVDCDYVGMEPYPYYDAPYYPYYGAVVVARPHRAHPQPIARRHDSSPKPTGRPAFSSARSTAPRQM